MYSKIKIYGDCNVNYIWGKKEFTEEEKSTGVKTPIFDKDTITLSTFGGDITASDIKQDNNIIIKGYTVFREAVGENKRYIAAKVGSEDTIVNDYNVCNNQKYKYYIIPTYYNSEDNSEKIGEPIITDDITADFQCCSIVGLLPTNDKNMYKVDKNNVWSLGIDVSVENYKANFNKNTLNGIGRFPHLSTDTTNFLTLTVSSLIGDIACASNEYYGDTVNRIEDFIEFCHNGNLKLFKDCKGFVIPCDITDLSFSYDKECVQMPTTVNIEITQLDDRKNISVYGVEG